MKRLELLPAINTVLLCNQGAGEDLGELVFSPT